MKLRKIGRRPGIICAQALPASSSSKHHDHAGKAFMTWKDWLNFIALPARNSIARPSLIIGGALPSWIDGTQEGFLPENRPPAIHMPPPLSKPVARSPGWR